MKLTSLLQFVDKLQQVNKIDNLQQVCGVFSCVAFLYTTKKSHRLRASCEFYRLDASLLSNCTKPVDFIFAADLLSSSRNKRCERILISAWWLQGNTPAPSRLAAACVFLATYVPLRFDITVTLTLPWLLLHSFAFDQEKLLEKRRLLHQLERQERDFLGSDKKCMYMVMDCSLVHKVVTCGPRLHGTGFM